MISVPARRHREKNPTFAGSVRWMSRCIVSVARMTDTMVIAAIPIKYSDKAPRP